MNSISVAFEMASAASEPNDRTAWISTSRSAFAYPQRHAVWFRESDPILDRIVFEKVHPGAYPHDAGLGVVAGARAAALIDNLEGGKVT
jgi:hypothetical protein